MNGMIEWKVKKPSANLIKQITQGREILNQKMPLLNKNMQERK